jgi:hypothetical protein
METSITALFQDAHGEGTIGTDSLNLLTPLDYNGQLQLAMGISADDVDAAEVTLVTMLMDNSTSMSRMADAAREGQHEMIQALGGSKAATGVLMAGWSFDPQPIHGYLPLGNVPLLDSNNYYPHVPRTPLFSSTVQVLGGVVAKTQEFSSNGVPVRSVTVIVTDGGDNDSPRHTAADVANLVGDLERTEMHIVMMIGIDDGFTDFRDVGRQMGIRDDRVMPIGSTPSELRRAVNVVSQSALQVSQSAGTISQVGFAAV